MSKRDITIYECDICKKQELGTNYGFTRIRLPYCENGNRYFMDDCDGSDQMGIIDCCKNCTEKIAKLLAQNIGFYNLNDDEIEIK